VAASRKTLNVLAHAHATETVWQIQRMVIDVTLLGVRCFLLLTNTCYNVFLYILAKKSSSKYSSDLEELREEARRRKDENKWQDTAIAASWVAYQEMKHNNQIPEMFKLMPRLKKDITATVGCDGNGLRFALKCDVPCFYRKKECDHQWNKGALDKVGNYIVFPSRWYHCGYYRIESDKVFYTAQLFAMRSFHPEANLLITRKINRIMIPGKLIIIIIQLIMRIN
jgi:hypothetical protein